MSVHQLNDSKIILDDYNRKKTQQISIQTEPMSTDYLKTLLGIKQTSDQICQCHQKCNKCCQCIKDIQQCKCLDNLKSNYPCCKDFCALLARCLFWPCMIAGCMNG